MPKFIRKPTVIEAEQFFPDAKPWPRGVREADGLCYYVITIHGQATSVVAGDWILPEKDGAHFYPCKDEVFRSTYEPVQEPLPASLYELNRLRPW